MTDASETSFSENQPGKTSNPVALVTGSGSARVGNYLVRGLASGWLFIEEQPEALAVFKSLTSWPTPGTLPV